MGFRVEAKLQWMYKVHFLKHIHYWKTLLSWIVVFCYNPLYWNIKQLNHIHTCKILVSMSYTKIKLLYIKLLGIKFKKVFINHFYVYFYTKTPLCRDQYIYTNILADDDDRILHRVLNLLVISNDRLCSARQSLEDCLTRRRSQLCPLHAEWTPHTWVVGLHNPLVIG